MKLKTIGKVCMYIMLLGFFAIIRSDRSDPVVFMYLGIITAISGAIYVIINIYEYYIEYKLKKKK